MKRTLLAVLGVGVIGILLAEGIPQWFDFEFQWIGTEGLRTPPSPEVKRFDKPTFADVTGSVVQIEQTFVKGRGKPQVILHVRNEKDTVRVSLGPSWFVSSRGFRFRPGDKVEVHGAWISSGEEKVLYTIEIRKGKSTLKLRTEEGTPLWEH